MRILVFGAGAIGSTFGGLLSNKGHDVTLLGRSPHMNAISEQGLKIIGLWGDHIAKNLQTATHPDTLGMRGSYDLILLTVRAYDTEASLVDIDHLLTESTKVISLQNGLGNVEKLLDAVGSKRAIGGRVIFGAKVREPGLVEVTVQADATAIGPLSTDLSLLDVEPIAKAFSEAGVTTVAKQSIREIIFAKVLYNAALNGLSSIKGTAYGELLKSDDDKQKMRAIVHEGYAIAEAKGLKLDPPTPKEYIDFLFGYLIPVTSSHKSSMLQAIEKGKRTEIDYLNGALVSMGRELGIETPANQWVVEQIKAKEPVVPSKVIK